MLANAGLLLGVGEGVNDVLGVADGDGGNADKGAIGAPVFDTQTVCVVLAHTTSPGLGNGVGTGDATTV
ncbi:hypothetical protein FGB62_32g120 [Gracilaria domingensis]|nr:hypothetical protein FGB62_32g120 [Gracilaria domingensis]